MIQEKVNILWNNHVIGPYYQMGLTCNQLYADAAPGQFIMLRQPGQIKPLFSRPFSIHRLVKKNGGVQGIEILYKVVGDCTRTFSGLREEDEIELRGPIGNGFPIPNKTDKIYIAAGGIGVAPIVFLAFYLKESGIDLSACHVFLGGRSKEDILCRDIFTDLGMNITVTTDDGSMGAKGLVTGALEAAVNIAPPDIIYTCGPMPMLKSIAEISNSYNIACQASIETVMACGMGVCLGCAVDDKVQISDKYRHVCIDGPVFDITTLNL